MNKHVIGVDPNGILRVHYYHEDEKEAFKGARRTAEAFIQEHSGLDPISHWRFYLVVNEER